MRNSKKSLLNLNFSDNLMIGRELGAKFQGRVTFRYTRQKKLYLIYTVFIKFNSYPVYGDTQFLVIILFRSRI